MRACTNDEQGKWKIPFELPIRLAKLYIVSIGFIAELKARPEPLDAGKPFKYRRSKNACCAYAPAVLYCSHKGDGAMPTMEAIRSVVQSLKAPYALKTVNIFGSFAEGRATPQSDLDLLVEFDTPAVSLIRLNALKYDLEDALGLPVDVVHAPLPAGSMIQPQKVVRLL